MKTIKHTAFSVHIRKRSAYNIASSDPVLLYVCVRVILPSPDQTQSHWHKKEFRNPRGAQLLPFHKKKTSNFFCIYIRVLRQTWAHFCAWKCHLSEFSLYLALFFNTLKNNNYSIPPAIVHGLAVWYNNTVNFENSKLCFFWCTYFGRRNIVHQMTPVYST